VLSPEIDAFEVVPSVGELIRLSDLIVDGTVVSVGPAVRLDQESVIPNIETDSVISVSLTLRDIFSKKRSPAAQIVLIQTGGKWQDWDIQPRGVPQVQPGERYIFFLDQVCGAVRWNPSALPRYASVGVSAGLLKVVNGQTQFPPAAAASLHESDGIPVESFLTDLNEKVLRLGDPVLISVPPNFHPGPVFDPAPILATERKPCPLEPQQ
jgi:hypothetical protein